MKIEGYLNDNLSALYDGNPVAQISATAEEYRIISVILLIVGILFGIGAVVLWVRFRIFHLFLMVSGIDARRSVGHMRERMQDTGTGPTTDPTNGATADSTTVLAGRKLSSERDDEKTTVLVYDTGPANSQPGFRIEQDKVISN